MTTSSTPQPQPPRVSAPQRSQGDTAAATGTTGNAGQPADTAAQAVADAVSGTPAGKGGASVSAVVPGKVGTVSVPGTAVLPPAAPAAVPGVAAQEVTPVGRLARTGGPADVVVALALLLVLLALALTRRARAA